MKLEISDLSFSYEDKPVLDQLSLSVREGEFVSILGPSGCGKSTILKLLTGVLKKESGSLLANGREISHPAEHFAYMPQNDLLFPWKNILDNVCLYGRIHGSLKEAREEALKHFPAFGLSGYEYKYPDALSGGMRQRAAFLRTALCHADILLLDEPFGALDVITRVNAGLASVHERAAEPHGAVSHPRHGRGHLPVRSNPDFKRFPGPDYLGNCHLRKKQNPFLALQPGSSAPDHL